MKLRKMIWESVKDLFDKRPIIAALLGGIIGGATTTIIMIHKNLGPLSEWVSGLLTLGAICITIYIQYDAKKIKIKFVDFKLENDDFEYEIINGDTRRYAVYKQAVGVINLSNFNVGILKVEIDFEGIDEPAQIDYKTTQVLNPYAIKYFDIPKDMLTGIVYSDLKDGNYYGTIKLTDFRGTVHIGEKKQIHQLVLKNKILKMASW